MRLIGNGAARRRRGNYVSAIGIAALLVLAAGAVGAAEPPAEVRTESGVRMVALPGGGFEMGEKGGGADETPHAVRLSPFLIDKYPVIQEEYRKTMGENPSKRKGDRNPVEQVRWADAVRYCNTRSRLEGLKVCYDLSTWKCDFGAGGYRLPTEAEWEYACRAGTKTRYSFGDSPGQLPSYAWFKDNSGGKPRPVGAKPPNPWGLCDMHGNVWEWCNDFYGVDYYRKSPGADPRGPSSGKTKVLRGGCWDSPADKCRSAARYHENPAYADVCFGYDIYGFRCVRNLRKSKGG